LHNKYEKRRDKSGNLCQERIHTDPKWNKVEAIREKSKTKRRRERASHMHTQVGSCRISRENKRAESAGVGEEEKRKKRDVSSHKNISKKNKKKLNEM
jgi:N-acetylmuramoyl-L-alanine amidase CwlA